MTGPGGPLNWYGIPVRVYAAIYFDDDGEVVSERVIRDLVLPAAEDLALAMVNEVEIDATKNVEYIRLYSLDYCSELYTNGR